MASDSTEKLTLDYGLQRKPTGSESTCLNRYQIVSQSGAPFFLQVFIYLFISSVEGSKYNYETHRPRRLSGSHSACVGPVDGGWLYVIKYAYEQGRVVYSRE